MVGRKSVTIFGRPAAPCCDVRLGLLYIVAGLAIISKSQLRASKLGVELPEAPAIDLRNDEKSIYI
jgi:hypothetical protein